LKGPRTAPTKRLTDFLNTQDGRNPIVKLEVSQTPLQAQKFLNVLSLGRFEEAKKRYGYDDVYHRFLIATLQDGKVYILEKNAIVEIRSAKASDLRHPKHQIPLPTDRLLSLKEMFDTTLNTDRGKPADEESKKRLVQYDAGEQNCQLFIEEVVRDNGLVVEDPATKKMLEPQNSAGLLDTFGALQPLARMITDLAGSLDRLKFGDGLNLISTEDENKLSDESKMTQYHSYALKFSDAQLKRLAEGLAVRLKHDDLSPAEGEGLHVCLTQTQINKIKKSITAGKGMQLQFSQAQLEACMSEHHNKIGAGIFSDALKRIGRLAGSAYRGVKKVVKHPTAQRLAKSLATSIGDRYGNSAVDLATGLAGKAISNQLPDVLEPFANTGMELAGRLTKEQLQALLQGMKSGNGLFRPGSQPSKASR
jgi:hypothetical protein